MPQCLRVPGVLSEDPCLVPSIHIGCFTIACNPVLGDLVPSSGLFGYPAYVACTHIKKKLSCGFVGSFNFETYLFILRQDLM